MATEESNITKRIQMKTAGIATLFSNVRGVFRSMDNVRIVHAGLQPKGASDLIGIKPRKITESDVGTIIGQYVAIEVKTATGRVRPEQQQYIDFIRKNGGIAGISRNEDDAIKLLS